MSTGTSLRVVRFAWAALFALLARPAAAAAIPQPQSASASSEDRDDALQNQSQSDVDRQQEQREREDQRREREQDKREQEQDRVDHQEDLYDQGREALDDDQYDRARDLFADLAKQNGPQTDAALYWQAYAQQRLGQRQAALTSIADLKKRFPQSRWQKDAGALEIEIRQNSGQPARPEAQADEELKMLAIQSLMNSDPERAMPLLEKVLQGSATPKEKSKALFVLAQSGSPQGREIIGRIARGQSNPELQRKAVEYLGIFGSADSRKIMADIYASSTDASLKRSILRSYMISGDKDHLFAAAKSEKDPTLRAEAIRQLGLVHGESELEQLYKTETSPDVKRTLLQAFFLAGDSTALLEAARQEKDPEVRRVAVRNLGLIHSSDSDKALAEIYARETDRGIREEVLNALFIQGNAPAIVAIARAEKDPALKKFAVQKLALMNSKEGSDYLMEILQK